MKRLKASKKTLAEKALRAAISEETGALLSELKAERAETTRLRGVLANISAMAVANATSVPVGRSAPRPTVLEVNETPLPQGPKVDLSEEDNLGEGRWA